MKNRYLFLIVFISAVSLLLASLTSMEQVEKLRADDYGTYIHPGPSSTYVASGLSQQISEVPVIIFHLVYLSNSKTPDCENEGIMANYFGRRIPIYLSHNQILI